MGLWSMSPQELNDKLRQAADSGPLVLLGRLSQPLIIAGILWMTATIWQTRDDVAELKGSIAVLKTTIDLQMSGRYRDTDAARDFRVRDQKDIEQDRRIGILETRFERLQPLQPLVKPR